MFPKLLSMDTRSFLLDATRLLLTFRSAPKVSTLRAFLSELGFIFEHDAPLRPGARLNESDHAFWIRSKDRGAISDELLRRFQKLEELAAIAPVYRLASAEGPAGYAAIDPSLLMVSPAPRLRFLLNRPSVVEEQGHAQDRLRRVFEELGLKEDKALSEKFASVRAVRVPSGGKLSVFDARVALQRAAAGLIVSADLNVVPMLHPACAEPSADEKYVDQWNLKAGTGGGINMPIAWDPLPSTTTVRLGSTSVFICIVDSGVELNHPDLTRPEHRGYDDVGGTIGPSPAGGPVTGGPALNKPHGTAAAGVAAANWDNFGVAGIAAGCSLFSVPVTPNAGLVDEAGVIAALDIAVTTASVNLPAEGGTAKRVIYIGYGALTWGSVAFQTSLNGALITHDFVVCAGSGNDVGGFGSAGVFFPARYDGVIGTGASDQASIRVSSLTSAHFPPDWSSSYTPGVKAVSVVAPGWSVPGSGPGTGGIPTTDLQGGAGYNNTTFGATLSGDYTGAGNNNFHKFFQGTSCAAAHVAGVAALLRSAYPSLTQAQIKDVIERTAARAGGYTYTDDLTTYPNGPYHEEVGYGRLDAGRALTFADVYMRDAPADDGTEPETAGTFWADSDIVVRQTDYTYSDVETNFDTWQPVAADAREFNYNITNYIYIRVFNRGPGPARNVRVRANVVAPSTGMLYPRDWRALDTGATSMHKVFEPAPWAATTDSTSGKYYVIGAEIPAGGHYFARFTIASTQLQEGRTQWGQHSCGLAEVLSDNDYAFNDFEAPLADTDTLGGEQRRRNNLIQRNLEIVNATSPWKFAFLAGNFGDPETEIEIEIDGSGLPAGAQARLALDNPKLAFPNVDFAQLAREARALGVGRNHLVGGTLDAAGASSAERTRASLRLLDRTRVAATLDGVTAIATLEAGSRLDWVGAAPTHQYQALNGAKLTLVDGKHYLEFGRAKASVRISKPAFDVLPLHLEIPVPAGTNPEDRFRVNIVQRDAKRGVVGGITLLLVP